MNKLDKRAKEVIMNQIEELGVISTEDVMNLVRPHFNFDAYSARERDIKRKANSLIAQFKDDKGVRTCYNFLDLEGNSKYVNIDSTNDIKALESVNHQISMKYYGLRNAKRKLSQRIAELSNESLGQESLFEESI